MTSDLDATEMSARSTAALVFALKPAQVDAKLDNKVDTTATSSGEMIFAKGAEAALPPLVPEGYGRDFGGVLQ